jgi:CheY-like chemotaxis protein
VTRVTGVEARPIVLVVEDEPLLRLFAMDMIEEAGFEVLDARNTAEALTMLETCAGIRVVFTDVDMPGGADGIALATSIRRQWPKIAIVITSGKPWPIGIRLPEDAVFFSKPYRQDRVIATIRDMAG